MVNSNPSSSSYHIQYLITTIMKITSQANKTKEIVEGDSKNYHTWAKQKLHPYTRVDFVVPKRLLAMSN